MKIKINNEDLELVYSFRSAIYFEQITGHNIDFKNLTGNDLISLFYCVVISSLQKAKKPIISMLEFLDEVDNNGGDKTLIDFTNWYIDIITKEYELINSVEPIKDEEAKEIKNAKIVSGKKKKA